MTDRRNARARFCPTCEGTGSLLIHRGGSFDCIEKITCPACFGNSRAEWCQDEREPRDAWIGLALVCLSSMVSIGIAFAAYAFVRGWW